MKSQIKIKKVKGPKHDSQHQQWSTKFEGEEP